MANEIIIRKTDIYPTRRAVMLAAETIIHQALLDMSEEDLRTGRRLTVTLRFIPKLGRPVREGEFRIGGYPRTDISQTALEKEISNAVVGGAV